jgi:hypothetical protein
MSPRRGKRTGEDLTKLHSHSHPLVGRDKERAGENVFSVKVFVLCSKRRKGYFAKMVRMYFGGNRNSPVVQDWS